METHSHGVYDDVTKGDSTETQAPIDLNLRTECDNADRGSRGRRQNKGHEEDITRQNQGQESIENGENRDGPTVTGEAKRNVKDRGRVVQDGSMDDQNSGKEEKMVLEGMEVKIQGHGEEVLPVRDEGKGQEMDSVRGQEEGQELEGRGMNTGEGQGRVMDQTIRKEQDRDNEGRQGGEGVLQDSWTDMGTEKDRVLSGTYRKEKDRAGVRSDAEGARLSTDRDIWKDEKDSGCFGRNDSEEEQTVMDKGQENRPCAKKQEKKVEDRWMTMLRQKEEEQLVRGQREQGRQQMRGEDGDDRESGGRALPYHSDPVSCGILHQNLTNSARRVYQGNTGLLSRQKAISEKAYPISEGSLCPQESGPEFGGRMHHDQASNDSVRKVYEANSESGDQPFSGEAGSDSGGRVGPSDHVSGGGVYLSDPVSGRRVNPSDPDYGGRVNPSGLDCGGRVDPSDPVSGGRVDPSDPDYGGRVDPSDPVSRGRVDPSDPVSGGRVDSSDPVSGGRLYLGLAEVLYKCSLCATLPAIMTSPDNFSQHVRDVHLTARGHRCPDCELHFITWYDVRHHSELVHVKTAPRRSATSATLDGRRDSTSSISSSATSLEIEQKGEQYPCDSNLPIKSEPWDYTMNGHQQDCRRESKVMQNKVISSREESSVMPCRSRRKRACPRHVEMEDQHNRCASTGSTNSSISEDSHSSDSLKLPAPYNMDYSLLRSDRKRLLPLSQRTKSNHFEEHGINHDLSTVPRATICYKPGSQCTNRQIGGFNHAEDKNLKTNLRSEAGPLDLVLQGRCATSISNNDKSTSASLLQSPEDPSGVSHLKKMKLQIEENNNRSSSSQLQELSRPGFSYSSQYEALCAWSLNFYNPTRHAATNIDGEESSRVNFKEEPVDGEKSNPCCSQCKQEFVSADQFCQHYKEHHLPATSPTGLSGNPAGDQQFKVLWLKQHITKYVLLSEGGCVLRDDLLDRMMASGVDTSDAGTWGPACNRAVRETFPDSQAHRKGKFKKYFFGIRSIGSDGSTEDTKPVPQPEDDGTEDEEEDESEEERGINRGAAGGQDLEKLTAHLPCVIRWTGHMDTAITRDSLLHALSRRLDDHDVTSWGLQCNRAIRQLFPEVAIRRKGKYKTCYYGIEMIIRGGRHSHPASWSRSASGPPVVNVRDILETPGPSSMSRLPRHQGAPPPMTSLPESKGNGESLGNPLQAILSMLPSACQSKPLATPPQQLPTGQARRLYEERVQPPANQRGHVTEPSDVTMTSEKEADNVRSRIDSPQSSPLALTKKPVEKDNSPAPKPGPERPLAAADPNRPFLTSGPVDALEKLILLHPGPFVAARIFLRRFQRLVPGVEKVVYAMTMLQGRGLGQVFTMKHANSKVFFKALPSQSLEVPLTVLGVRMVDYQVMFYERDQKLDNSLHEKLKAFYPQPDMLATHYRH